jgi:superfamily II DNA or RNA helicase
MNIRDQRQEEFASIFQDRGILHLCPRFGKCRVGVKVIQRDRPSNILITYPTDVIKKSWQQEFVDMGINGDFWIQYLNFRSLNKVLEETYDLIVIDEIHMLSENQVLCLQEIIANSPNAKVLGLTGTLAKETKRYLKQCLDLNVIAEYPIEKAIEEGIISDYEIRVAQVDLDNKRSLPFGKKYKTEKKQFSDYTFVINKLQSSGGDTKFLKLNRMRLIQNSIAKMEATRSLLSKCKGERCLVFCGLAKIADNIGCKVYHSKNQDEIVLEEFCSGTGEEHLATVKMLNQGITIKAINYGIINYFDSNPETMAQKINRFTNFEYDNPGKRAIIYIICSTEKVEQDWLKRALEFFDKSKIIYE